MSEKYIIMVRNRLYTRVSNYNWSHVTTSTTGEVVPSKEEVCQQYPGFQKEKGGGYQELPCSPYQIRMGILQLGVTTPSESGTKAPRSQKCKDCGIF